MSPNVTSINTKKYFVYALLIKGITFLIFAYLFNKPGNGVNINYIFTYSRDYPAYINPAINLVETGEIFENSDGRKLYAHKMPGMTPIFAPLYYFLGFDRALTILVVIQFLIDALTCVLLALIALRLFNKASAFYLTFYTYSLSTIVSIGTHHAVSELFCTSFAILALYFICCGTSKKHLLLAGFFATWSVFFRPPSILLFVFLPLFFGITPSHKFSLKQMIDNRMKLLLFVLPFVLFESIWIIRNYRIYNRFIPADTIIENFGSPAMQSVFKMILTFGGDLQSWNENSEMRWFNTKKDEPVIFESDPFPSYVFRSGVTLEELRIIREKYHIYNGENITTSEKRSLEMEITQLCLNAQSKFKTNSFLYPNVIAPLRTFKTLVIIHRPYGFSFGTTGVLEKLTRLWHFISYYFALLFYILGSFFMFKKKISEGVFIVLLVLSHALLYGFLLRYSENRYLVPVHPFMLLIATGACLHLLSVIKEKKRDPSLSAAKL